MLIRREESSDDLCVPFCNRSDVLVEVKEIDMDDREWAMIAAAFLGAVLGAVLAVLVILFRSF